MHIEGTYEFETNQQLVWDMLQDPEVIGSIIPGSNGLEEIGDNLYQSVINVKVGPVSGKFEATVELKDINAIDSYTMVVNAKSPVGFADGEGVVTLSHTDGLTTMSYVGDARVGGRIAAVGQRLLDVAAKGIIKQGLNALAKRIEEKIESENSPAE